MKSSTVSAWIFLTLAISGLAGCGGGGGGGGAAPATYTVGGTVSGLKGTVVLQNNGGDNLAITADGGFTFPAAVESGGGYNVTIFTQPARQRCTVRLGTGTVAGNVGEISVDCLSYMGGSMQSAARNLTRTVSTLAGTVSTFLDGTGGAARFNFPRDAVSDGTNVYVTDAGNNAIRKIVIATGEATTLAGSPSGAPGAADGTGSAATFNYPVGITIDYTGTNLYVADAGNNKIRKIVIATGEVSSLTGAANQVGAVGAADGPGTSATFRSPHGVTTDGPYLYVADGGNNKIRKIVIATRAVSSMTGAANQAGTAGAADGPFGVATFSAPTGIAAYGGNLYVADSQNNKIRKLASGIVSSVTGYESTVADAGADDGVAWAATFNCPTGVTTDGSFLYVADWGNHKIRKIALTTGAVSSVTGMASTAATAGAADGTGTAAKFSFPGGITTDGVNLYVADVYNSKIRKIALGTGMVSSLAGRNEGGNGIGAAADFYTPIGTTTDGINLYVADSIHNTIRKIELATGVTSTFAGKMGVAGATDGAATDATFYGPSGLTTDGTNLYVADRGNRKIRKIVIATGVVSSLTGIPDTAATAGAADGAGSSATFSSPHGITTDGTNLYVGDVTNHKIRRIVIATGEVSSLTGIADTPGAPGALDGVGTAATFQYPLGLTTDGTNLYVADTGNYKVRKVVISTGEVSSLTGSANAPGARGALDGVGTAATFDSPQGITTDGANLYVADVGNNKIRVIVIATGEVSSLTGVANAPSTFGAADGAGAAATFCAPLGITTDGKNLYVTDGQNGNGIIRQIE